MKKVMILSSLIVTLLILPLYPKSVSLREQTKISIEPLNKIKLFVNLKEIEDRTRKINQPLPGFLDTTFGSNGLLLPGGWREIWGIETQSDGKIVVAGTTPQHFLMARSNSDGSIDQSFNTTGFVEPSFGRDEDRVKSILIQPDGKIVVAGVSLVYTTNGIMTDFALARFSIGGSLDPSFGSDGQVLTYLDQGYYDVASIVIQKDGQLVVIANMGQNSFGMLRYNSNGTLDTTFGINGVVKTDESIQAFTKSGTSQQDGKLLIGGEILIDGTRLLGLARFQKNGELDFSFGTNGFATINITGNSYDNRGGIVAIQNGDRIILTGNDMNGSILLARFNSDGSLDSSFGTKGKAMYRIGNSDIQIADVAIQPDNKIILAGTVKGSFTSNDQSYNFVIIRLLPNGLIDQDFGIEGIMVTDFGVEDADYAHCATLQRDGKILVAGGSYGVFGTYDHNWHFSLARYIGGPFSIYVPILIR
jgi:uncharacterized delta-60 repeat protein